MYLLIKYVAASDASVLIGSLVSDHRSTQDSEQGQMLPNRKKTVNICDILYRLPRVKHTSRKLSQRQPENILDKGPEVIRNGFPISVTCVVVVAVSSRQILKLLMHSFTFVPDFLDLSQDGVEDRDHHGGSCRVGHPHGQEPSGEHDTQHQPAT